MVVPVLLFLGLGWGGAERSLLVLGPMSTFALPLIAMIAFWWEDWPGTMLRAPLAGLADTVLVAIGGVLLTVAGQALGGNVDLRGVFDPGAVSGHAPTFPATMPVAGAVFVAMLELTLVSEGWPLRRLNRYAGGVIALAAAWAIGVGLYLALVDFQPAAGSGLHARHGPVAGAQLGAALVCIGVLQVGFFVVLRGWPFATFLAYIVLIDFGEYWRHRLQHRLPWWWALHSLHHDQRQLTLWSDDRNHLIDDVLASVWSGTLALCIGVAPEEYPLVIIAFRLIESLSSADVSELPLRERIEVVVDTAWSCYSSPTSMAAFEILRATRGGLGQSSRRHLLEMNSAIGQLGRLISDDPANAGVAEVIWATLRGVVLAQMVTGTAVDWSLERRALIDMVTRVLQ